MGIKSNIDEMISDHERAMSELSKGTEPAIEVGFFEGTYPKNGANVPSVAYWLEYGTSKMTPKYFMSRSVLENEDRIIKLSKQASRLIEKGASLHTAFTLIGMGFKTLIQQQITKQGHIDTGRLRQSVTYEVV